MNAGINRLDNDEAFDLRLYREVIDTNLYGALNFIAPLTRVPAVGVERHIVAISSMVNYAGNPYGLGYYASKKALTVCFDVWADMYAGTDLVFKQVMLGPVHTAIYTMGTSFPAGWSESKVLFPHRSTTRSAQFQALRPTRKRNADLSVASSPAFGAMWLGRRLIPGFFQGRKTLAGRPAAAPVGR